METNSHFGGCTKKVIGCNEQHLNNTNISNSQFNFIIMKHKDLEEILVRQFSLTPLSDVPDSESAYLKYIQEELIKRISYLIQTDIDRLVQILYRIDISAEQTDFAFSKGELKFIAQELSMLIIKRQLSKIEYARNFNKENK